MSEGKRGGRGRGKRGGGYRGRGRARRNEPQQSETSTPGGLQERGDEERVATLPVGQPPETEPQQTGASSEQASTGGETQQKRTETPKKHRQRKRHGEQTGEQHGGTPEEQPAPEQQPKYQAQQQDKPATERFLESEQVPEKPFQKQQSKQQDQTDGAFSSKPVEKPASASAQVGGQPKATPTTPQQQPSKTPPSQPTGKQQRQATKTQTQQQPTHPPRAKKGELRPPLRPDKGGTSGRPIRLRANFLPVQLPVNNDYHHYDTSIKADFKTRLGGDGYTKTEAAKIVQKIVDQYYKVNPSGPKLVYDKDGKNLYCRIPIPGIGKDKKEFKITFMTDNGKEREYTVTIQWAAQVSLYYLNEALEGRLTEIPQNTLQAVQAVLRFLPSMTNIPIYSSFFSYPDGHEKDLGLGLQIWDGRFVSIRPTQWKMMLNVDTSSTAFYKAQPVLDFMCDYLGLRQIPTRLNKGQSREFRKEIKTILIEKKHVKGKQRVSGLSEKSPKEARFTLEDGKMTSVFDYFKSKYNITLQYPDLPCLELGRKENLVPMELCSIVEGQRKEGRLTPIQTREMIKYTALPAPQRQEEISKLIRNAKFHEDPYCRDFGIKVGKEMATIEGRVLDPPLLNYGPADKPVVEKPRDGVWNMQNKPMYKPKELKEWALISYENERFLDDRAIGNFINRLVMSGKEKHLRIHPSPCYQATQRGYEGIGHLFGRLNKDFPRLELVIIIFPGKGSTDEYYEEVKHFGDVVYGIRTQCIKANNAKKADMQTLANICLKINAKLGGTTSVIDKGIRSPILKRPVIIFGADVTHPAPSAENSPSIAAVVASMDSHPNLYSAEVRLQKREKKKSVERILELKEMVVVLLKKFRSSTGVAPEKIIFYRDGVSEGQFKDVLMHELQAFQHACRELHPNYKPQITFIVVQKRHHARFFAENPRDQRGKSKNIPAGTIVDKQVCHPFEFDWYLCSHAGIQGTSKPSHYHVLYDDSSFKSDELQILTNQLCHTYVRCARAVSIPAPVYYAHHVAFRARYHLKEVDRGSGEGSTASGEDVTLAKEELIRAVKVHDKMSSTMYFA